MLTSPHFPAVTLRERLAQTRTRIASAASRYARETQDITLVAVSKGHPAAAIRELATLGHRQFGENYLQEALNKLEELSHLNLEWHFIGQIQANKTRPIAEHFAWVHTVDRAKIAERLHAQRPHYAPRLNICIQVRLAEEESKGGISPEHLTELATQIIALPRLHLRGLMCIPPPAPTFAEQLKWFEQLRQLRDQLVSQGFVLDTLSMGMSADLEAAIAAGSTLVRIGTALFGERGSK